MCRGARSALGKDGSTQKECVERLWFVVFGVCKVGDVSRYLECDPLECFEIPGG